MRSVKTRGFLRVDGKSMSAKLHNLATMARALRERNLVAALKQGKLTWFEYLALYRGETPERAEKARAA